MPRRSSVQIEGVVQDGFLCELQAGETLQNSTVTRSRGRRRDGTLRAAQPRLCARRRGSWHNRP
jgi:hypothetical protein